MTAKPSTIGRMALVIPPWLGLAGLAGCANAPAGGDAGYVRGSTVANVEAVKPEELWVEEAGR